jgi:pilus assembly protein CpaB
MGLGIIAAVVTAVLIQTYLQRAERKLETRFKMTTVLTAKRYISVGKNIGADLVAETEIPVAYVEPGALQSLTELKDQKGALPWKSRIGLMKGEQITKSKLFRVEDALSLAWTLSPGHNAVSFRLSLEKAVSGLVQPGDRVNVFCTMDPQPGWDATETREILHRALAVAVEDRVWDPSGAGIEKRDPKNVANDSILITLSLTPREAALAALAMDKGRISLALTSPMEAEAPGTVAVGLVNFKTGR